MCDSKKGPSMFGWEGGENPPQFATGALEWQIGKTEAAIDFVRDAEAAIAKLQQAIDEVKAGTREIGEFTTLMSIIYGEG